jgi:cell division transport system ATP-binding protein
MIFQQFNLVRRSSVLTNVLTGRLGYASTWQSALRRFGDDDYRRALINLDRVGLRERAHQRSDRLSGGQQQRVGIARAIVHRPALLLADEPTGNLDPRLAAEIMGVFEDINRLGTSVLIASHDLALIARMRHRMLTLQRGRLIGDGEAGV